MLAFDQIETILGVRDITLQEDIGDKSSGTGGTAKKLSAAESVDSPSKQATPAIVPILVEVSVSHDPGSK